MWDVGADGPASLLRSQKVDDHFRAEKQKTGEDEDPRAELV